MLLELQEVCICCKGKSNLPKYDMAFAISIPISDTIIVLHSSHIPGIGKAIAENLAGKGTNIVLGYTSEKSGPQTEELRATLESTHGISCLVVQADMAEAGGPAHLINTAKNHFSHPKSGKFQIDIIINNAGVSKDYTIENCTVEGFEWQYKVNVLGPLLLMQAAMPYLPTDRSGRIVNLSSVSSSFGFIGQSVYGGTKAALECEPFLMSYSYDILTRPYQL